MFVDTPDGAIMQAYHDKNMNINHLPISFSLVATEDIIHMDITSKPLMLMGQLWDHDCDYILIDKIFLVKSIMASSLQLDEKILPTVCGMSI